MLFNRKEVGKAESYSKATINKDGQPLETHYVDHLELIPLVKNYIHIFVATDRFSKFT